MFAVLGRLGTFVDGPGPSWAHSSGLCWRSWAALGINVGSLGRSWGLCWRSWAVLGRNMSKNMSTLKMCLFLERERDLPPRGAVLGLPWNLCWRSWAAPGIYVGDLGAILGCSWAYVAGLGPVLGLMLAVLGPLLAVLGRLGPKSGQGPGGETIWQAIRAEKWPEKGNTRTRRLRTRLRRPRCKFFS